MSFSIARQQPYPQILDHLEKTCKGKTPTLVFCHEEQKFSNIDNRSSVKNPIRFGSALIKTRLAMEFGDRPVDVSNLKPPTKLPADLQESETLLDEKKLPLDGFPGKILGDTHSANEARHVLILTSWRSGSTFLGDILNHYPGTFYSFEPLHYISRMYKIANESLNYEKEIG
jgi:hypothetical protein